MDNAQAQAKLNDAAGNSYYRPQDVLKMRIIPRGAICRLAELFLSALFDADSDSGH